MPDPDLTDAEAAALADWRSGDLDEQLDAAVAADADVAVDSGPPALDSTAAIPADKQAWIDEKHAEPNRGPDDAARAGMRAALDAAQAPPADSLLAQPTATPYPRPDDDVAQRSVADRLAAGETVDETHVHTQADLERMGAIDLPRDNVILEGTTAGDGSVAREALDAGASPPDWPLSDEPAMIDEPSQVDPSPADAAPEQEVTEPAAGGPGRTAALDAALAPQLGLDLGVEHTIRPSVKLTDRFVVPPFTTLDSRQTYWKERKRAWLGLGIQSELGREGTLTYQTDTVLDPDFYRKKEEAEAALGRKLTLDEFRRDHYRQPEYEAASIQNTGTSIFDPVMCEIAYRWFSPPGGTVLDPFAGGSVRGIVASILGRHYCGIELRPEQIAANVKEAARIVGPDTQFDFGGETPMPHWVHGSATDARALIGTGDKVSAADAEAKGYRAVLPPGGADLIFTCPPYADLEVYSDDPRDLSTAPYPTFRAMLASAMAQTAELLKRDRFAVWVVGEARDRDGYSYGIIRDTVTAGTDAGLRLYNEAILETAIASAAMRATKQVRTSRKLVRVHQHVLVFVKGDPRTAALACGDPTEVA